MSSSEQQFPLSGEGAPDESVSAPPRQPAAEPCKPQAAPTVDDTVHTAPDDTAPVDTAPVDTASDDTATTPADATSIPGEVTPADTAPAPSPSSVSSAPTDEPDAPEKPVATTGAFEAYSIGDPGRAFTRAMALNETKYRDAHDIVIDAATVSDPDGTPRLVLRGASSRGLAHQNYGDPRQDDHCVVLSPDSEWLVCLVADGVSAGEWSHLAAKVATEEGAAQILKYLKTHEPSQIPFRQVFTCLAELLGDVCATLPDSEPTVDLSARDIAKRMATTLVIAIVATRPSEDGTHEVTVVRLGDTSAWILDAQDGWIALGDVKNAGNTIAESATASLPLVPDADPVPVQTTLGADAALVLITDGIGDPLGSGKGEVGRHLARLWATPPHPVEFAAQIAFGRKTFDDDRGAIAVWLAVPE